MSTRAGWYAERRDDGDLRRLTHRLRPPPWAMHDKRAVERSPQGPAALGTPEPRLLFLVLVGWAGWRLRRQRKNKLHNTYLVR